MTGLASCLTLKQDGCILLMELRYEMWIVLMCANWQYICILSIQLHTYNTSVHLQYICILAIHLQTDNTSSYLEYICILRIHLYTYNTSAYLQYICILIMHLHTYNTSAYSKYSTKVFKQSFCILGRLFRICSNNTANLR